MPASGYSPGNILETFQFVESREPDGQQVVMTGNEALAYGLIAAGVRFGAAYPITPWSEVMELLRRELPKYGGTFVQCEDEIASISMAIGASWAGRVAVTGSSGPGISLKQEALGWAVMAEVPLVVVDVQRGGPSTGMPTSVEQSDLNIACFGGHGDAPRVVIAPTGVEDCFYTAIEAVNIARKYNVPVVILSDQAIATRIEAFEEPNLEKVCQDISPDLGTVAEYTPYDLDTLSGVTPRKVAGTRILNGKYPVASGLEHDEMGHPTGSPKLHTEMTAKRRRKLQNLAAELPVPQVYGPPEGNLLLVGWGSTQGPLREAVDRARAAGRQRFRRPHPLHQPAAAGAGEHFRRLQPRLCRRDERRGPLRLRPVGRPVARPLLRSQNPRPQQDRRPDLARAGNPRARQERRGRRPAQAVISTTLEKNFNDIRIYEPNHPRTAPSAARSPNPNASR